MTTHEADSDSAHEYPAHPLSVPETSALFGVSVSTLRRLLAAGKLPNATKRKGPKGDEWVIPAADMVAEGYTVGGPAPVPSAPAPDLEALRADYENRLTELRATHAVEVEGIRSTHRAQVDALTQQADYERKLRESAEETKTVAATLAVTLQRDLELTRSRLAELEAPKKVRRGWFRKQTGPEAPK